MDKAQGSEILDYGGFYAQATVLLRQSANAATARGDRKAESSHINHLGLAYRNLGQYQMGN